MRGNVMIGQSGGPTSVINASLCGVVQAALANSAAGGEIGTIYGMKGAIEGLMNDDLLDFRTIAPEVIDGLKRTPGSALGSCRHKVQEEDFSIILSQLKKYNIRYFFLIGGDDTMHTIHRVEERCRNVGYELRGVGIPKTVDNDLRGTDHTPGFPSAAKYVTLSVMQAGTLARDMKRVDQFVIHQTVGRSAGWLPAAAALAKRSEDDAPHIILMPERAFDTEQFLEKVAQCQKQYGWCSIVVGEGVCDAHGNPVSASTVADKFGNTEMGAMAGASIAMELHKMIRNRFGWRGEFQVCESLPMCAADRTVSTDVEEAYACGRRAVELAIAGHSGVMVTIERLSNEPYRTTLGTIPLCDVAGQQKPMTDDLITPDGFGVTQKLLDYLRPIVGELPQHVRLY